MLDKIDKKILGELQANARISNIALSRKINLSEAACLQRVRKLVDQNYVVRFSGLLNPKLLDASVLLLATLKLDNTSLQFLDEFNERISFVPEVQECHYVSGSFDYFVKIRVKDMQTYKEKVMRSILAMPGVREMHTYSVLTEVKNTTDLFVP